jgi:hypothetical protein
MFVRPRLRRRHVLAVASLAVVSACRPPLGSVPGPNRVVAPLSQVSTSGKTTPAPTDAPALPITASAAPSTPLPAPSASIPPTATPSVATPVAKLTSAATATPAPVVPPLVDGRPGFSEVSQATPSDVVAFLTGRHPRYPGSDASKVVDFSPSDILETMDTIVLDRVRQSEGDAALQQVYDVIAGDVLATLRSLYPDDGGDHWVLVALDAGHGGKKGFFWDPGSEGTEAEHTRAVVAAIVRQAERPENRRIVLRRVYNDDVADDFGLGNSPNRTTVSSILMRQARSAMLAFEARAWNQANPALTNQVFVHELSMHFNAGAGGALVLHQGDTVQPTYQSRSLDFGRSYLRRVVPDLNATGLLPTLLTLWAGTGLHDDVMMYRPSYMINNPLAANVTLRYGVLQGGGYMPRFVQVVLTRSPLAAGAAAASAASPNGTSG